MRVLLLLGAALLVALVSSGQPVPRGTCLDCHADEGMRYADLSVTPFQRLGIGSEEPLEVKVVNPWDHELTSMTARVRVAGAVGFAARAPLAENQTATLQVSGQNQTELPFPLEPGATGLVVRAAAERDPLGINDADLFLVDPSGAVIRTPPDGLEGSRPVPPVVSPEEVLAYEGEELAALATGNYVAVVEVRNGVATGVPVTLSVNVWYNATTSQTARWDGTIAKGQTTSLTFLLTGTAVGEGTVDVEVDVTAYYLHPANTGQDEGNASMAQSLSVGGGESTIVGTPPTPPAISTVNWKVVARSWGETAGFTGLFMMLPSLLLGGAFGAWNVRVVNRLVGDARTRVLWHNSFSTILLVIAIVHLTLMLYEPAYRWAEGLLFGGITLSSLIGLALTGFYYRRISQRWGYATWRKWHVMLAAVFVFTGMVHAIVDGRDFGFVRELVGE